MPAAKLAPSTLAAIVVPSILAWGLYILTSAPGAWWGDGLEFSAAAWTLGVPHPTGYPLYMMIGYAVTHGASFADAGRCLTILSGIFCAVGVGLIGLAMARSWAAQADEVGSVDAEPGDACREDTSGPPDAVSRLGPGLALAGAIAMLATTPTLWQHATFAEVYPLTFVLGGLIVAMCAREARPGQGLRPAIWLGIVCGLALLNHYSILALAPLALATVWHRGRERGRAALHVCVFVCTVLVLQVGYLYIPLRAAANPAINWGDPVGLRGLAWVLGGGDYAGQNVLAGASMPALIAGGSIKWLGWIGAQIIPLAPQSATQPPGIFVCVLAGLALVCLVIWGLRRVAQDRPALGYGLIASLPVTLIFAITYRIPDLEAYFLPALPALVLGVAYAVRSVWLSRFERRSGPLALVVIPLGLAVVLFGSRYRQIDKSWDNGPQIWAQAVFENLPPEALIITRQASDAEIYALWYEQIVKGVRRDVIVFGEGFIFSGWYARHFEATGKGDVPLFITDRPVGDKATFDIALAGGVIAPNIGTRRIFTTGFGLEQPGMDPMLAKYMRPRIVAELLPTDYYARTAYRLNPPGQYLIELNPSEEFLEVARRRFAETFGRPTP